MASLGSNWHVEAVTSCKQLYLKHGSQDRDLTITKGRKSVLLYNVENREPIKSWTCKPDEIFTSGVVYDSILKQFTGIVNSKAIRLWTLEQSTINDGEKIRFSSSIYCLLSELNHEPLIVFDNGYVEFLRDAYNQPKHDRKCYLNEMETIHACDVMYKPTCIEVALVTFDKAKKSYCFTLVFLDSSGREEKRIKRELHEIENPHCFCFLKTENLSLLVLAKSSKEDAKTNVYDLCSEEIENAARDNSKYLKHYPPWIDCKHNFAVYLENNHLGVMRIYKNETIISLWDLCFGIEKASRKLPGEYESMMWNNSNCLLLTCSDKLYAMPYTTEVPTLSTVLGSKTYDISDNTVGEIEWDCKKRSRSKHDSSSRISLNNLPSKYSDSVTLMLNRGLTTSVICREIFTSLIEKQDKKAISTALEFFIDIPEDVMVHLIKYFLECQNKMGLNYKEISPYLNMVLKLPFSDSLLQDHIRNLSLNLVKILLEYLQNCLRNQLPLPEGQALSSSKIADWLCVIFDAHFYNLIMMEDESIITILAELNTTLKSQFAFFEELQKLEKILNSVKLKAPTVEETFSLYNIQILKIV